MTITRITSESTTDADAQVGRLMHVGFVSCAYETPLRVVAGLMAEHRVHCIVGYGDATADDTLLWGLLSDVDVVAALAAGEEDLTAGQLAATEVVTVTRDTTARRAAALMRDHGVSHVLVVDGHPDRPVGILSTLDLAGYMSGVERPAPIARTTS